MHSPYSVLSVSELNKQVKIYLEQELGVVHVEGELSNFTKPSSGHYYFTLKDRTAQVRCVFFRNRQNPATHALLQDGQQVLITGTLSLYEARGDYQLIVERLTEQGLGTLHQQFDALKKKLAAEGLFLPERKKSIPAFPKTIGLITSRHGAAIADMLSTLARRYPLAHIVIYPSEVQGVTAPAQLINALKTAHIHKQCDVLILARGGGSIEDLWAFNDEQLARAIASSTIPIISGVGHETDFTIADFVADFRAETPTAAAVAASPNVEELQNQLIYLSRKCVHAIMAMVSRYNLRLDHLVDKISSPQKNISIYWQTLDYAERQLFSNLRQSMIQKKHLLSTHTAKLQLFNPHNQLKQTQTQLNLMINQLTQQMINHWKRLRHELDKQLSTLHAVSPLATLERGYSIAHIGDALLFSSQQVTIGDKISLRLAKGSLECEVFEIQNPKDDDETRASHHDN